MRGCVCLPEIMQAEGGEHNGETANNGEGEEYGAPAIQIGLYAAERGADGPGATAIAMPTMPIAMPRRASGKMENTVICSTGHITPVPHGLKEAAEERQRERRAEPRQHRAEREHDH